MLRRLGIAAGLGSAACSVFAAELPVTTGSPVIVTASPVSLPEREVGSAISVITAEQIQQRQARFVLDLLRDVPGLAVSQPGTPGNLAQVRIRGAEGNHTLVLVDGVRANDPAAENEFDFAHLVADDIERIEILRGPQSAIYGSESLGGVISIITKRGRRGVQAGGYVETGSFSTANSNAYLRGAGDIYDFALSASQRDGQGANISRFGSERDGYRNKTLGATGALRPTGVVEFNAVGRYVESTTRFDTQDFFSPTSPSFGFAIDSADTTRAYQYYGRIDGKLKALDGRWTHRVGAEVMNSRSSNQAANVVNSTNEGHRERYDYLTTLQIDQDGAARPRHAVSLGMDRTDETFVGRSAFVNNDVSNDRTGVFAEYRLSLFERLFLSAGGRHDDNNMFQDADTYRLTAAFLVPGSGLRLHGSYGKGIKNPSFFELFGVFPPFVGNPDLKPETSRGYDLGVEQSWSRGKIDITYFHADLQDEIVPVFGPISTAVNQTGESRRSGVEVQGSARINDAWSFAGHYTYLDAEEQTAAGAMRVREIRRPRNIAGMNFNYAFRDKRGNVNLGVRYNGAQLDNAFLDPVTFAPTRVTLGSYTLVNFAVSYDLARNVTLFGRIENLLDERYEQVFSYRSPGLGAFLGVRLQM
jgi:vitamin B12 transporter